MHSKEHLHLQVRLHEYVVGSLKCRFRIRGGIKTLQVLSSLVVTIRVTQIKPPHVPQDLDLLVYSTFMCNHSSSTSAGGCGQPDIHGSPKCFPNKQTTKVTWIIFHLILQEVALALSGWGGKKHPQVIWDCRGGRYDTVPNLTKELSNYFQKTGDKKSLD